jgi:hypothetical protein
MLATFPSTAISVFDDYVKWLRGSQNNCQRHLKFYLVESRNVIGCNPEAKDDYQFVTYTEGKLYLGSNGILRGQGTRSLNTQRWAVPNHSNSSSSAEVYPFDPYSVEEVELVIEDQDANICVKNLRSGSSYILKGHTSAFNHICGYKAALDASVFFLSLDKREISLP